MKQLLLTTALLLSVINSDSFAEEQKTPKSQSKYSIQESLSGEGAPSFTDTEKRTIMKIARDTLAWRLGGVEDQFSFNQYKLTAKIQDTLGTFVMIKLGDKTMGLSGRLFTKTPIAISVHELVQAAVKSKGKEKKISLKQLPDLKFEITIVGPISAIRDLDNFKAGQHGIRMQKGPYKSFFLPDEADTKGDSTEQIMDALAKQARMPNGSWKRGTRYWIFPATTLSEE